MADLAHDDPVAFNVQQHRAWAWRECRKLGTKAKSEMVRLLALREFLSRTDPMGVVSHDPSRPINVAIVLSQPNGHARALPDADGLRIHLRGANGGEA